MREFVAIVQGDTDTARTLELAASQAGAVVFLSPGFRARRFGVRSFIHRRWRRTKRTSAAMVAVVLGSEGDLEQWRERPRRIFEINEVPTEAEPAVLDNPSDSRP